MTLRLGVVGLSEGNGHPFSFSAIVNGYDDAGMAASGWPVIHDYLRLRDPSEFGGLGAQVTHAWTQSPRPRSASVARAASRTAWIGSRGCSAKWTLSCSPATTSSGTTRWRCRSSRRACPSSSTSP